VIRILFSDVRRDIAVPAIFIDRDGVINCHRPGDYVLDWCQFVFVPGIRRALRDLSSLRLPMIVISNQAAVGKGLLTRAVLEEITVRMHQTLLLDSIFLSGYYYCPHTVDEGCDCRKPRAGMLRRAATDFNIDLRRSIFIGDSDTDIQAACAADCQPLLFGRGAGDCGSADWMARFPVASSAKELFGVARRCLHAAGPVL
jgi:D,D-heptose 1,7-bisphosphate phosphatase